MATGTVTSFSAPAGHGLILADTGEELFVHHGSILIAGATIAAGDRVAFEMQAGGMGLQAIDIRAADTPAA